MIRFGPRQEAETSSSRSRHRWSRLVPMLALVGVVVLLSGCGSEVVQPYSHITPQTDKAEDIQTLYKITFWAALIVFIGVQTAILYTALRFRRRNEDRPEQVHGSRKLEIAWTIIPAVILLVLFIPNAQVIFKHAAAEQGPDKFDVDVIGKQWWWEFRYRDIPADPNNPDAGPLVTANEVLLPVGADVVFHVTSNNVIHSFWVPQLSGKVDVIPGHDNPMQFVASTPGDYFGECAEFCGAAHAWMRFKVKIVPEENFDAWVNAWRTPPAIDANAETADVMEAPPAFGACLACHNITGTNARIAQQGMAVNSGYLDPQTRRGRPGARAESDPACLPRHDCRGRPGKHARKPGAVAQADRSGQRGRLHAQLLHDGSRTHRRAGRRARDLSPESQAGGRLPRRRSPRRRRGAARGGRGDGSSTRTSGEEFAVAH